MPPGVATLVQDARHALLACHVTPAEFAHHNVAVAFEQRHQRLNLRDGTLLFFGREQSDEPAVIERVATASHLVERLRDRACKTCSGRDRRRECLLHEREEVLAHPRHARELRPVRDFVDRDPEPEVERPEREALLEREDVGPDVVDGVAGVFVGHQEVVLAEHALREVADEPAHLRGRDLAAERRERAAGHARTDAVHERLEQAPHGIDVGVDPALAVEHFDGDVPRRAQAGELGDERPRRAR